MSQKAEKVVNEVNATMSLEGMPLTDKGIDIVAKIADGVLSIDEAIALIKKEYINAG